MPSDDRRLLSAAVTLALVAFVWPMLARLGTFRLEAAIGTVLALAWVTLVALVLGRSGWQRLWLAMLLPFVVWWPLMFAFMAACTQDGSCP
jgi:hypothetical protein